VVSGIGRRLGLRVLRSGILGLLMGRVVVVGVVKGRFGGGGGSSGFGFVFWLVGVEVGWWDEGEVGRRYVAAD